MSLPRTVADVLSEHVTMELESIDRLYLNLRRLQAGNVSDPRVLLRLDPEAAPFFPPTDAEGVKKRGRMGLLPTNLLQAFLRAASMIAYINAIVGGVTFAMGTRRLLGASGVVSAIVGGVTAVACAVLFFVYQVRRFQRAASVVPETYDWDSLFMFGAAKR